MTAPTAATPAATDAAPAAPAPTNAAPADAAPARRAVRPEAQAGELRELLGPLLDLYVKVTPADPPDSLAVVAQYRDEAGALRGLLGLDLRAGAYLSAALTRIPKRVAQQDVLGGALSEGVRENCHEVLNVCTNLFPVERYGRLVMGEVLHRPMTAPEGGKGLGGRGFVVEVTGYGSGVASFTDL